MIARLVGELHPIAVEGPRPVDRELLLVDRGRVFAGVALAIVRADGLVRQLEEDLVATRSGRREGSGRRPGEADLVTGQEPHVVVVEAEPVCRANAQLSVPWTEEERLAVLHHQRVGDAPATGRVVPTEQAQLPSIGPGAGLVALRASPAERDAIRRAAPAAISGGAGGHRQYELANPLVERCAGECRRVGLAPNEEFGEMDRLLDRDLGRHRRLERIDDGFDEDRAGPGQGLGDLLVARARVLDPNRTPAARFGDLDEVDRLELDAVFGIAEEDHLLPFDLTQDVVLDDDDLDRQVVLDRGREVRHEHAESAVADEGDDLALRDRRPGPRSRTAARRPSSRGCRTGRTTDRAGPDVAREPGRDRAESDTTTASSRRAPSDAGGNDLRLHRHVHPGRSLVHERPPVAHPVLGLLQEPRSSLRGTSGSSSASVVLASPTRPTSTG